MAVLPTQLPSLFLSKHSLRLILLIVVIACPVSEVLYAADTTSPQGITDNNNHIVEDEFIDVDEEDFIAEDDEEFTPFSINASAPAPALSSSALEKGTELPHLQTLTEDDAWSVYQTNTATTKVTTSGQKTIEAPVVKFKLTRKQNSKTKRLKEVIELEENRLQLDHQGKRAVLIDASELPSAYQSEAILQLSLRYRRHCSINKQHWGSTEDALSNAADSMLSHKVYQESSVKPFSSSRNLYLLQVDLCPQRRGQVFSLYFSKEKNIRSMVSKFGSIASYIIAAKVAGQFVSQRTDPATNKPYWIADGDNGGFMDTFAAALPAGAVFNGIASFREEIERWNLSGYDSDISACVTAGLMVGAMNTLDSDFTSNTSQMFVSNAGRLYSRSAFFGELYSCLKHNIVDHLVYGSMHFSNGSHNATDAEAEEMSSLTTSVLALLGMYAYDFIDSAEMKLMQEYETEYNPGKNKLERTRLGNVARGGSASSPYKAIDSIQDHISPDLVLQPDDSWSVFSTQMAMNIFVYTIGAYVVHYSRPYEMRTGPKLGQMMLNTRTILGANIMEAAAAHAFGLVDQHISQPVAGYLAESAVNLNYTVPDSWMYKGIRAGVRFTINAGTAYVGINTINYAGKKVADYSFSDVSNDQARLYAKNNRFLVDVIAGTTTNGVVLPLVLSLDEDVFTPVSDGASYFLCSPKGWGIGCPTRELQLGIVVDRSGHLAADTHVLEMVTSD